MLSRKRPTRGFAASLDLNFPSPYSPQAMLRISIHLLILLLLALFGWSGSSLAADPIAETGGMNQLLVLRNGNILQGEIVRMGDYYHVVLPHGEMRVPAKQVEMCCASLEEAYLEQRATRTGSTADSHVQLAKWCLRHNLLDYARRELDDARAVDSSHPGAFAIEKQIDQITRAKKHSSNHDKTQRKSPGVATPGLVPNNQLTTDLAKIPQSARAQFVRQIEPLLLRNCATSGCHQPHSPQKFRIDRLAMIGRGHPRVTRQNLTAVLEQIDAESKSGGPLLSHAASAHGATPETESAPLDSKKLQLLRQWAKRLATQNDLARSQQPLAAEDIKVRLMKRWDKRSDAHVRDSVVVRRASAPIFHHPSQTVTVQKKKRLPEITQSEGPQTEKTRSTEQAPE